LSEHVKFLSKEGIFYSATKDSQLHWTWSKCLCLSSAPTCGFQRQVPVGEAPWCVGGRYFSN
jgi:hypothetical protein